MLGFGVVGINLAPSLKLVKHRGWEFDSYDVVQRRTGRTLLSIYLGSNWGSSGGTYAPVKVGPLNGVQQIVQKQGRYRGTIILNMPKHTADQELVYDFENLNENQYNVATALIHSTCLSTHT